MAKNIMIQGTMSNVGKSLICAGLCRIFKQDGYISAPFKSQNMALNSYITRDGLEIGRAQAMQAEAAGIEPSALMNPILLKPTSDNGSQVIVNGKAVGNMRAAEYFRRKKELVPTIRSAYDRLAEQTDIIVIEGAGSPAEMNLKADDIVNMGLADIVDAPVLLVGDIDRGGVFAQLIGTVSLLESHEKQRIKGLIVNKFRGDRSLFEDGIKILEEKSNKPVIGVVPYVDCDIDDEDSLSDKLSEKDVGIINIAVIKLPKISNYTDFSPFSQYIGVSVRYIDKASELGEPDMIIIPGSKSTISDMKWLRESGFESLIKQKAADGIPIFGICGGYQMLGKTISDPENTECGGEICGLELLDTQTVFCNKKTQKRSTGIITAESEIFNKLSGIAVSGYEIHMGQTKSGELPLIQFSDERCDGAYKSNIFGTYLHGIFDDNAVSSAIVSELFKRRGLNFSDMINYSEYRESQYNLLADTIRQNINIEKIYEIIL
ncbi:MAG: cobyric acid synthase [Clostridium sp.]|nr:cobyric acid synthase [Clostridium sp.]MCM1546989.1 cobyric acid synthase [Ruminococcus sp.]